MLLPACAPEPVQEAEPVTEEAPSTEADVEALKAIYKSWDNALNNRDLEGLVSHYTEDAVRMEPNKPAWVGRQAIRAGFESAFEQYESIDTSNTAEDIVVSGEWAIARISGKWTVTPQGGEPIRDSGKAMSLCKRQPDGSWKVVWDIWNADTPSPAPPTSQGN
jgi:uncharacterized protein (TIGR02246 family)